MTVSSHTAVMYYATSAARVRLESPSGDSPLAIVSNVFSRPLRPSSVARTGVRTSRSLFVRFLNGCMVVHQYLVGIL